MVTLDDGELIDREPVVGCGVLEIDDPCLRAANCLLAAAIFDGDAVHQESMARAIAAHQFGSFQPGQPAEGILQRLGWQIGIETGQHIAQAPLKNDLPVIGPFRC